MNTVSKRINARGPPQFCLEVGEFCRIPLTASPFHRSNLAELSRFKATRQPVPAHSFLECSSLGILHIKIVIYR